MTRLSPTSLALAALVAAVATFVLVQSYFGMLPPVGWAAASMLLVAVVDLVVAWRVRRAVRDSAIGFDRSQIHPVTVSRYLALGQASAALGALVAGFGAGLTAYLGLHADVLAAAADELPAGIAVFIGGLVCVGTGLFLERSCEHPGDDDHDGGAGLSAGLGEA